MLVIIKFEGLSLRLVFLLIVVILIHIRSMIKQTAVTPNFPPHCQPLFLLWCYRDRLITLTSSTVAYFWINISIMILLHYPSALNTSKPLPLYTDKKKKSCWVIVGLQKAHTPGMDGCHMCAFMRHWSIQFVPHASPPSSWCKVGFYATKRSEKKSPALGVKVKITSTVSHYKLLSHFYSQNAWVYDKLTQHSIHIPNKYEETRFG